jgi:hypothetical protein
MDTPKPEPEQESMIQAIRKVELAVAALMRDPNQRDEVVSSLDLHHARALAQGVQRASCQTFQPIAALVAVCGWGSAPAGVAWNAKVV